MPAWAVFGDLVGVASATAGKAVKEYYNALAQTSEMNVLVPVYEADVLVLDEPRASKPPTGCATR